MNLRKHLVLLLFLLFLLGIILFFRQDYEVFSVIDSCEVYTERCTCYGILETKDSYPPQYRCIGVWQTCEPMDETVCA